MKIYLGLALALFFTLKTQAQNKNTIEQAIESLRLAMINPNKEVLEGLVMDELSYGHSGGKIEDKASFIENIMNGNSDFETITLSNQKIIQVKNTAVVRYDFFADARDKGVKTTVNIHILTVWVCTKHKWKLLARQAIKIAK